MRCRARKWRKGKVEDVAALRRKVYPAVCRGRQGPDRLNLCVFALEADDAKGRAHARDFRDEQFGHGVARGFLRRGFVRFACCEMRWRISTLSPCSRQCAARRSAT